MEKIKIEQDSIFKDFYEHILISRNNRILFTAPFGTGKTTFLKEFFDKKGDEYIAIDLYPVQYSVSQNEDVFELIKFDILLQLIGKYEDKLNLQKEDFSFLLTSQVYVREHLNVMPMVNTLLSISEKTSKYAVPLIKLLIDTVGDLKEFQKEMQVNEKSGIDAFLKSIENKEGSAYEMDSVSNLIYDLIQRVQGESEESSSPNESVLIIDDLDRLDPEHIFRLFNVFSSQFNMQGDGNKFGFDKIIFVCDIDNIRRIYEHKYGSGVDFQGYIDKFYSLNAFIFDNKGFVKERIDAILKSFTFSGTKDGRILSHILKKNISHKLNCVMRWMFLSLIDSGNMNLRMLINPPVHIVIPTYVIDFNSKQRLVSTHFPILGVFHVLKSFYGSFLMVKEKLNDMRSSYGKEKIQKTHPIEPFSDWVIDSHILPLCLPFLLLPSILDPLQSQPLNDQTLYSDDLKCDVNYSTDHSSLQNKLNEFIFRKFVAIDSEKEIEFSAYEILYLTFDKCLKNGYLSE